MITLSEDAVRLKVRELLDLRNERRMEMFVYSGITAGVLEPAMVERLLMEEIAVSDSDVRSYWASPCTICYSGEPHEPHEH